MGALMTDTTDTRDRVIAQGVTLKSLETKVGEMDVKLTAMHNLMLQGQGAAKAGRWIWSGGTVVVSFLISQFGGYLHLPR
jgi:hypothetical protein